VPIDWNNPFAAKFKAAMDDDFATPEAVAALFELAAEVNRSKSAELAGLLKALGGCLGLLQGDPRAFLQWRAPNHASGLEATRFGVPAVVQGPSKEHIEDLIQKRAAAKKEKNFAEADRIRQDLLAQGIVLKDSATGTTWESAA
jgi:cysteinyl-tRNA synthetase